MSLGSPFLYLTGFCSFTILLFIVLPLYRMVSQPTIASLVETIRDPKVFSSIWLSIYTAMAAALISFVFGTPLAYLLARHDFPGKKLVESIIDLPIMIPHPVVGIAILSLLGRGHYLGQLMAKVGLHIMGSVTGIIVVLTFVGLPFYINSAKAGFESVPVRLENVSRSLGAGRAATFFRVTAPLTWRHMLGGFIMCAARAVSEFGAVVIVAYHPMIAPVLMYERFTAYGLKYSQPVGVWLILVCLLLFTLLRLVSLPRKVER
ncbi:molybdenum ABC transporter permease [Syntrophotalea acetylenivorans]|uniref:Molybdenum ABC transporter permease n=1 Tax=Syntrophotalea acetylenivorans TaxID=1842532 RepID=A0A1L3GSN0_9BACT|nr:molybdenum ABC transporter permease [Syntrophotalea acetylenivorans]